MNMIENLDYIRDHGVDLFLQKQTEEWLCPEYGGFICCNNGLCLACNLETLFRNKNSFTKALTKKQKQILAAFNAVDDIISSAGSPISFARRYLVMPSGSRNASFNNSPGVTGSMSRLSFTVHCFPFLNDRHTFQHSPALFQTM